VGQFALETANPFDGVIPKSRVFTSGTRNLVPTNMSSFKLHHYPIFEDLQDAPSEILHLIAAIARAVGIETCAPVIFAAWH
jgi:hypothetical protein